MHDFETKQSRKKERKSEVIERKKVVVVETRRESPPPSFSFLKCPGARTAADVGRSYKECDIMNGVSSAPVNVIRLLFTSCAA
ncbi:hypothetical protein AMECASPLE_029746 [Ameca splendens]|uniref:Uncharacterized protein n=1 Tax=Ameca splendens TaxID=208324 RepID=A0ABV0XIT8_9TELE